VSQSDSFIEEVTEEVRRDRLYGLARRYGWIVGLGLVLVVGGAAFLEWQKSRARAAAEGLGDTIFAAMESGTPQSRVAALSDVTADGVAAALVAMLAAAELAASDPIAAADRLESVIENTELPRIYRDLATLKLVMLADNPMFSDGKIAACAAAHGQWRDHRSARPAAADDGGCGSVPRTAAARPAACNRAWR